MAEAIESFYETLPGKWELDCQCGDLQIYTFNTDLTFEVVTFPKTWGGRFRAALAGKLSGNWYLKVGDEGSYSKEQHNVLKAVLGDSWVNPEKQLWFNFGSVSPGLDPEAGSSLRKFVEAIGGLLAAAFDRESCGVSFVTLVDKDTINIRMKPPCGGVLRRVPTGGSGPRQKGS